MRDPIDDLVIQTLCSTELDLRERIASLEADVAIYRLLGVCALDALAETTARLQQLRQEHEQLLDRYQALCERLLLADGADEESET